MGAAGVVHAGPTPSSRSWQSMTLPVRVLLSLTVICTACGGAAARRYTVPGTGGETPTEDDASATGGGGRGGRGGGEAGSGGGGGVERDAGDTGGGAGADAGAPPDDSGPLGPPQSDGAIVIPTSYPTGSGTAGVSMGANGKLVYTYDSVGDTVPDFSNAGYMGGGVKIPTVKVATTLGPMAGEKDASGRIQAAIDALAKEALGSDGFRGAILLQKGVYPLQKG